MGISLTYDEKIVVVDLGDDENRFSPGFLDEIDCCLDDVVGADAQGLVTTGGGKFYSNGLDLDWLAAHGEQTQYYVGRVQAMLARMLTLPVPTAAAVDGHAFGGGDAASLGLVDAVAAEGAVATAAIDILRTLDGKDPGTLGAIKHTMFEHAVRTLTADAGQT